MFCKQSCVMSGCLGAKIMKALVIIGALNWGLVGALDLDLVQVVFGSITWLADLVYILVGVSGLVLLVGGCRCGVCKGRACGASCTEEYDIEESCCGDDDDDCCGRGACK